MAREPDPAPRDGHRRRAFLGECLRVLRPGGLASHVFDHRDHLHHADPGWPYHAHWALPDPIYGALFDHPLGYHNRLAPTDVARLFSDAGFERVAVRRMALPDGRYVDDATLRTRAPGVPDRYVGRRFRSLSDRDRRAAAAHYLFRKPAR